MNTRYKYVVSAVLTAICLSSCGGGGGGGGGGSSGGGSGGGVSPVNTAPVLTSGYSVGVSSGTAATVYMATATDPENNPLIYSISGTDAARFSVNATTGALSFTSAPNFAAPVDADADNEYLITLTVGDGSLSASQTISVIVSENIAARSYSWSNAKWGGGGYISGFVYHPRVQNLLYARTDVGGVYRYDAPGNRWMALNDDLGRNDSQLTGILSMAVDPNDSQKLYLAAGQYLPSWGRTGAILRSNDRGASWARTELPIRLGGNSDGRGQGERLQVDPNKGSILFLGTNQDGLYKSSDSGVTWSKVTAFTPTGTTFVLFDPRSGTAGNATQTLYVGVSANATTSLYRSTDGGASWSPVPGQPVAYMPQQAAFDANGNLFITYGNAPGPNNITDGAVYRLNTNTGGWAGITPAAPSSSLPFGYSGVSVDAQNAGTLIVSTIDRWNTGDGIYRSTDYGATWTHLKDNSSHSATVYPWLIDYNNGTLAGKMGHWMTDIEIDPFNADAAVYNTGYGLWMTRNLTTTGTINWTFDNKGFEETVVLDAHSPRTGGHLLIAHGDVAGARYASNFDDISGYFDNPVQTDVAVDTAEFTPEIAVRTSTASAGGFRSTDGGISWTALASKPVTGTNGVGKIAVSAGGTSFLWVPNGQVPAWSANNGVSWTNATGWPVVPSDQYFAPVADRAVDGYYYTYDYPNGRLYESADGGKTFASVLTGLPQWKGSDLISIPGKKRRDLWVATTDGLYHIDGAGAAPVKLSGITEAYRIGYGAPAPGQTYYALYVWGKVGTVTGLFRSDDKGVNWIRINDDRHQYGWLNDISGDPRVFGRIYLATGGRGLIIGNR